MKTNPWHVLVSTGLATIGLVSIGLATTGLVSTGLVSVGAVDEAAGAGVGVAETAEETAHEVGGACRRHRPLAMHDFLEAVAEHEVHREVGQAAPAVSPTSITLMTFG